MARNQEKIRAILDAAQAAETVLASLNNPSQTSEYNLWKDIYSAIQVLEEILWDTKEAELNAAVALAAPATAAWIKWKVEQFQYSSSSPQVVQLVNFVPTYPTIAKTLQIITRCSVSTSGNNIVKIKVAKSAPPTVLSALEASSLTGYISAIIPAGVVFQLINSPSDKLYIDADIYYNGQYSATISDDVIAAINSYLKLLPADGIVEISALQNAINDTPGVTDVKFNVVKARQDSTAFASATTIYDLGTSTNLRIWSNVSASIVEETTVGNTFTDTLNFIVAN
jgi:hypothetical protein